jgi:hypothetical protein
MASHEIRTEHGELRMASHENDRQQYLEWRRAG